MKTIKYQIENQKCILYDIEFLPMYCCQFFWFFTSLLLIKKEKQYIKVIFIFITFLQIIRPQNPTQINVNTVSSAGVAMPNQQIQGEFDKKKHLDWIIFGIFYRYLILQYVFQIFYARYSELSFYLNILGGLGRGALGQPQHLIPGTIPRQRWQGKVWGEISKVWLSFIYLNLKD